MTIKSEQGKNGKVLVSINSIAKERGVSVDRIKSWADEFGMTLYKHRFKGIPGRHPSTAVIFGDADKLMKYNSGKGSSARPAEMGGEVRDWPPVPAVLETTSGVINSSAVQAAIRELQKLGIMMIHYEVGKPIKFRVEQEGEIPFPKEMKRRGPQAAK